MSKRFAAMIVGFLACSCSSTGGTGSSIPSTSLAVSPDTFQGEECAIQGDGLKRYTATLVDVTGFEADAGLDFELPSSPPAPCNSPVRFANVVPGHRYIAKIAGYDRTDIEPVAPGSPVMAANDVYVAPRWSGTCGVAPQGGADAGAFYVEFGGPIAAVSGRTVTLKSCRLAAINSQE